MVLRRAGFPRIVSAEERVIELGRVVIPADNTPLKGVGNLLIPAPIWRYKGPERSVTITYQVGRWGVGGFAGDTAIVSETFTQRQSDDWATFEPEVPLKGVKLTGLHPSPDDRYDMEMWFKATGMADEAAIFTDCCEVPAAAPELEVVSCSFT